MPNLLDVLEKNYQAPHFVFMREFRDATGFDSHRSADALAFGMYRSRGQFVIGFEVKTARSDWLRELKNPSKAEPIARFCDFFHLVVPDLAVARVDELPEPWGLIHVDVDRLKTKQIKKPVKLDAAPITRPFLCAIVKQAIDSVAVPAQKTLQQSYDAGFQKGVESAENARGDWPGRYRKLEANIKAFEEASGIEGLEFPDGAAIGAAVSAVRKIQSGEHQMLWSLRSLGDTLERNLRAVRSDVAAIEALLPGLKSREKV